MGNSITIHLPIPPDATHPNKGKCCWQKKMRLTALQRNDASLATHAEMVRTGIEGNWKYAKVQAFFKVSKQNDSDNLLAWLKASFDGLADAKLIVNDKNLMHFEPQQEIVKGKHRREVTLVVTEIGDAK